MHKLFKQSMILFICLSLLATLIGAGANAQDTYQPVERSGEKMTVDALLLRPAGALATIAGCLVFVVSLPFSALGKNTGEAFNEMVKKPAAYTFKRPLGDF